MSSVGKKRAEVTCELLNELNPDVHGDWIDASISDYVNNGRQEFSKYNLIIACDVTNVQISSSKHFRPLSWLSATFARLWTLV